MGHRVIQRINQCDICEKIPEDGENMWEMGRQIWCEECCDKQEENGVRIMSTFDDLKLAKRPGFANLSATIHFENGYGAIVICGHWAISSDEKPFELSVLKNGRICYDTPITDDVVGNCTEDEITSLLQEIEYLPMDAPK